MSEQKSDASNRFSKQKFFPKITVTGKENSGYKSHEKTDKVAAPKSPLQVKICKIAILKKYV